MFTSLAALIGSRPRRALAAVLLFVLAAGAIGGTVADRLDAGGDGFAPADSDSVRAVERLENATGHEPSPGVVLLVETPDGVAGSADRIAEVVALLEQSEGVASVVAPDPAAPEAGGLRPRTAPPRS